MDARDGGGRQVDTVNVRRLRTVPTAAWGVVLVNVLRTMPLHCRYAAANARALGGRALTAAGADASLFTFAFTFALSLAAVLFCCFLMPADAALPDAARTA